MATQDEKQVAADIQELLVGAPEEVLEDMGLDTLQGARCTDYELGGVLTQDAGFTLTTADGLREYQVTVKRSR